jgi:hypothetical protein
MVTTVKLQDPFEYSWWVLLVTAVIGAIAVAVLAYVIVRLLSLREKKVPPRPAARKIYMSPEVLLRLKNQYSAKVQALLTAYTQGSLGKRDGYQQLSALIREFVHEVTGINVETLTASEIRAVGIKKLDLLMEDYYVPEFAEDEKAKNKDFAASCNHAMGVIRSWS